MDSIKIRKYKPDDHKDVSRIFGAGMSDMQTIKNGIAIGRKSPYVIGYLTIIFLMGSFYSLFYGFIALTIGLSFHAFIVYFMFNFYTWYVSFLAPKSTLFMAHGTQDLGALLLTNMISNIEIQFFSPSNQCTL